MKSMRGEREAAKHSFLHHIVTDVFSSLVLWKVLNENLKIPEQAPAKDMNAK